MNTETVSDVLREAGAAPANDPLPPIQAAATDATALAVRESLARVDGAITEFEKVSAGLTELRRQFKDVAFAVSTKTGMAEAVAARAALRGPRVKVEALRKDAKAPILALGRDVDARAAYIRLEILKLEEPIDEQITSEQRRVEQEREAKRLAEEARVRGLQQRLDGIRQMAVDAAGTDVEHMDGAIRALSALKVDATWQEFEAPARNAQAETLEKLTRMRADQARRDAEAAELARLRAEDDARKAQEEAARAEERRRENDRLKAEAQALADARKAQEAEFARREAELRRQETEAAAKRAEEDRKRTETEAAARAMREVEEAQARRAEGDRLREEAAAAEQVRIAAAKRLDDESKCRNASGAMLVALLAVRDWDSELNAMPPQLADLVQAAIAAASPADAALSAPIAAAEPATKRPVAHSKSQVKRLNVQLGLDQGGGGS